MQEKTLFDEHSQSGFCTFVPLQCPEQELYSAFLDIRLTNREHHRIKIHNTPFSESRPLKLIQQLISNPHFANTNKFNLYQNVLGPVLQNIWKNRYITHPQLNLETYGIQPSEPQITIIVPLYGRLDFMQFQLAQFCQDSDFNQVELIYILDDPKLQHEFKTLCDDCFQIFQLPFVAIDSGNNLGFAACNNLAIEYSHGTHLLLLNSDVFPKQTGWLKEMQEAYNSLENVGAIGPQLLYSDNSIQHAGMKFEPYPLWNNMWINEHPFKGMDANSHQNQYLKLESPPKPQKIHAITAACLMVSRELYIQQQGLSEEYIIGDFEDSDFCLKLIDSGKNNYFIPAVELYHLERQSQSLTNNHQNNWRENLTYFNCWQHHQKWDQVIQKLNKHD